MIFLLRMISFKKSRVQGYYRTTANGIKVFVREHTDSRTKQEVPAKAPTPIHHPEDTIKDFGPLPAEVAQAAGIPQAPIRLFAGKQISNHKGFGKEHIREQHGDEIRRAGYASEEDFVTDVLSNFNAVYEVGDNRFALVSDGKWAQKVHIVEIRYTKGQRVYSIVTGYIADWKKFDERRAKLLWKKLAKALRLPVLWIQKKRGATG